MLAVNAPQDHLLGDKGLNHLKQDAVATNPPTVLASFPQASLHPTTASGTLHKHSEGTQHSRILGVCLADKLELKYKETTRSYHRLTAAERRKGTIVRKNDATEAQLGQETA